MFKNFFRIVLLFMITLVLVVPAAAAQQTLPVEKVVAEDDLNREVTVTLPVKTVISMAPSVTEILCALDACDKLAGVDMNSNYPDAVTELPQVTNPDLSLNLETIVDLAPDLVILAELQSPEDVKSLEDLGITVFYLKNPESVENLGSYFLKIGELIGKEDEAKDLTASIASRIDAVKQKAKQAAEIPTVFYELDATDPTKPWTTSGGTFIDQLVTLAGGKNIAADLEGAWVQLSLEKLILDDPEFIILADANYGVTPESVASRTGWEKLSAVTTGKVLPIDSDITSRPGPRIADALEMLFALLHPELAE